MGNEQGGLGFATREEFLKYENDSKTMKLTKVMERKWETLSEERKISEDNVFSILTQNVMAQRYTNVGSHQYPWVPMAIILEPYRTRKLIQELIHFESDIFCLQELSRTMYNEILKEEKFKDYDSVFSQITGFQAWELTRKDTKMDSVEGLAIFWNKKKFNVGKKFIIKFNNNAYKEVKDIKDEEKKMLFLRATCLMSHNIALVLILEHAKTKKKLVISTIHNSHRKKTTQQTWQLETYLTKIATVMKDENVDKVILCGDFNVAKETPQFDFIMKQRSVSIYESQTIFGLLNRLPLHNLKLKESYPENIKKVTHFSSSKMSDDVLDYVFYQGTGLYVHQVLDLGELASEKFPNENVISDHLLLGVKFVLE